MPSAGPGGQVSGARWPGDWGQVAREAAAGLSLLHHKVAGGGGPQVAVLGWAYKQAA